MATFNLTPEQIDQLVASYEAKLNKKLEKDIEALQKKCEKDVESLKSIVEKNLAKARKAFSTAEVPDPTFEDEDTPSVPKVKTSKEAYINMFNAGLSAAEISAKTGLKHTSVNQMKAKLKKEGLLMVGVKEKKPKK